MNGREEWDGSADSALPLTDPHHAGTERERASRRPSASTPAGHLRFPSPRKPGRCGGVPSPAGDDVYGVWNPRLGGEVPHALAAVLTKAT